MAQAQTQQQAAQEATGPSHFRILGNSLYVGDLEPNVTEAQLFQIFTQVAPVLSIRVCRDLMTQRHLGYAYVSYNTIQEATRALELLNFAQVNRKAMRVMFSRRDPSGRNSGKGNIYVKNLEMSIDSKGLFDTFSPFGSILSCKVPRYSSGKSKGYGFIQFEFEESATSAIENMNGMLLNDKQVSVSPFVRRQDRNLSEDSSKFSNVYVKNISKYMTDEELENRFGAYGTIRNAVVVRDREGKSKGFGFVKFERVDDAARAVKALNGRKFDSEKEWYVGRAQTRPEREAELRKKFEESEREERIEKYPFNLYLKNLHYTVDENIMRELFAEFGDITSCRVLRDEIGRSRRFGFVAFSTALAADGAISGMSGRMVRGKPLYVARAENEEERRAAMLQGYGILATPEPQFTQRRTPFSMDPANSPMYDPSTRGIGQQSISQGEQSSHAFIPLQPAAFSNQQQMPVGIMPGGWQIPNFNVPNMPRQVKQGRYQRGQSSSRGHKPPQQQTVLRGGNRSHYTQNARNTSDVAESSMVAGVPQLSYMSALASSLASTPPEKQRATLGEQLYPMVDKLEHNHAQKVTSMLLQLDKAEVLYLMESPEALVAKVFEAIGILRIAAEAAVEDPTRVPTNQLA